MTDANYIDVGPDSDKCSSTCTEGQYQCTDCACVTDQTHCYVISSTEDPNQETSGDTNQQASTVSASPVLNKGTSIIYIKTSILIQIPDMFLKPI